MYSSVVYSTASYPYSGESGELEFPSADTYLFKRALLQPIYQYFFMITKPFQQNLPSKLKDVVPFNMWLNEFEGLKKSYTGQFGLDLKKRAVVNVDDNKLRFSDALAEDCLTFCKRMSAHSTAPNRKVALDSDTSILTEKLHTMFRDYIDRIRLVCQDPKIIDKGILNWLLTLELVVYDSYSVKQDYVKERVAESYMLDKNITYFYFDICMKNVFEMANDYFKDSKKIPLVSPNPNNTLKNQNKSDADVPTIMHSCEINYRLLHKEWNNTALYKVSLKQLTDAIDYANFFDLFNKAEKAGKRAGFIGSLRYIMIILHKKLGDSWYMAACKSIGTTPDQNDKQHRNTKKIKHIELSLLDECIEEKSDVD